MNINTASIAGKFKVLLVVLIAATLSLGFYVYQGKEVILDVDGVETELVTYSTTVKDLIKFEDVEMEDGAYVNFPLDKKIENNLKIIIKNPKDYTINDGGEVKKITSVYDTVEEVLESVDLKLNEEDYTYPELNQKVKPNSTIRVYRVTEENITEESEIPFETEIVKTKELNSGETRVVQEGQVGTKETHITRKFLNGILTDETINSEEVVSEPVKEIVEHGTREVVQTSRGPVGYSRSFTVEATAYDSSFRSTGKRPGDKNYGITATGTRARRGVAAVDPRVIPLGTRLYVQSLDGSPDYGYAVAEDVGGAIKGGRIDLFHDTYQQCRQFGRRNVKVYILD